MQNSNQQDSQPARCFPFTNPFGALPFYLLPLYVGGASEELHYIMPDFSSACSASPFLSASQHHHRMAPPIESAAASTICLQWRERRSNRKREKREGGCGRGWALGGEEGWVAERMRREGASERRKQRGDGTGEVGQTGSKGMGEGGAERVRASRSRGRKWKRVRKTRRRGAGWEEEQW